jgi:hypothetical protein
MRAKRILLASAAAAAAGAALAVGAAFVPAVQTWAARRALASYAPGATLGRFSAGVSRMSAEGLRLERGGAVLEVPRVDAELRVFSALAHRRFLVRNLTARGWTLDLARPRAAPAADRPAEAGGADGARAAQALGALLAAFNVPEDLSLDGVDLEGRIVLPDEEGRPIGAAQVRISGGGLAAGGSGRFACDADIALDDPAAPVSSVQVRGSLEAAMDPTGTFARAGLRVGATARGPRFPDGIGLSCSASAARDAGRTTYSVALTRGADRVAAADAVSADGSRRLTGAWSVDLRDTDLAPFALGRRLPTFHLAGAGDYDVDAVSGDIHASGKASASADRLGVMAAALGAVGGVDVSVDFDLARKGDLLRVERLDTSVAGAAPVASVRALQAFELNLASGELRVARPSDDIVGISVGGMPLGWLGGLLPRLAIAGGDARGEFVMRAESGRLALRTKAPLAASGVSVSRGGRALASGLDVSAFVLADYSPQGWQAQLAPLAVRSDGIRMLSVEARLGRLSGPSQALKAAGSWSAALAPLLSQPALGALPRLSGGEASGSFEASLGQTSEARIKVSLGSLSAGPASPAALPSVSTDARVDFHPGGWWEFSVPLRLDYGSRVSNLALSGTVSPRDGWSFDATLAADRLAQDDLAALALLPPGPAAAGRPGADGAPQARPFWPATRGRLAFVIGEAALHGAELRNLRGTLTIAPESIHLESGMAAVGDASAFRADGDLVFTAGSDRPFSLKAAVSADNIESAPLFAALDPAGAPEIEGRFDVSGHMSGSGAGLDEILSTAQGDCTLASKDGVFRMLQVEIPEAAKQTTSKIAGAIDSVASLFGKKAEKLAEAMGDSVRGISDIHYDQLKLSLERGADLDVVVSELALTAPEERITGSGRITYVAGEGIASQPLSLDLDMGVRGGLAKVMGLVGLLSDGQDELGYTHLYEPIQLRGTLGRVDRSQLRQMLVQAPLRKGGGLFDKLLGR